MNSRVSVISVHVGVEQNGETRMVQVAGAFDRILSPEAARACGKAVGEVVSENLERRLRHGETLGTTTP